MKVSDSGGSDFKLAPEGTHMARCVQIIDLGTQFSEHYGKSSRKVLFGFDLVDEKNEDDSAVLVYIRLTASLHKRSNLRAHLESWRGKPFTEDELKSFDLSKVIGAPCMVNVQHTPDKKYANIKSIMAVPKGAVVNSSREDFIEFDIDDPNMEVFEKFGDKLKETIRNAEEWNAGDAAGAVATASDDGPSTIIEDDDIPF